MSFTFSFKSEALAAVFNWKETKPVLHEQLGVFVQIVDEGRWNTECQPSSSHLYRGLYCR